MGKRKIIINTFLLLFLIVEILCVIKFKIVIGSGISMSPTIKNHQILFCEYTDNYNVDDIVLYKLDGISIVHRIVKVTKYDLSNGSTIEVYTMKGDNNLSTDMFETYRENIVCKIKGV